MWLCAQGLVSLLISHQITSSSACGRCACTYVRGRRQHMRCGTISEHWISFPWERRHIKGEIKGCLPACGTAPSTWQNTCSFAIFGAYSCTKLNLQRADRRRRPFLFWRKKRLFFIPALSVCADPLCGYERVREKRLCVRWRAAIEREGKWRLFVERELHLERERALSGHAFCTKSGRLLICITSQWR